MLLNSVEIAEQPIPVSDGRIDRSVWGVATWTDVDPRIDFFSVLRRRPDERLSLDDNAGAYKPGDTPGRGRQFTRKMLQLNFWRPGDELHAQRAGIPLRRAPRQSRSLRRRRRGCLPLGLPVG